MINDIHSTYSKAKPDKLPRPTYWPFFAAMGLLFMAWGLLTFWIVSVTGALIFIISLSGWINILRHERKNDQGA